MNIEGGSVQLPSLHTSAGYEFIFEFMRESGRASEPHQVDPHLLAFLAFCLQHSWRSKAQFFQDLYALYRVPKRYGIFVDLGASDGVNDSNTFLLEKELSWSGVVADPLPFWHESLYENRKCAIEPGCVWSSSEKKLKFLASDSHPALSTISSFSEDDWHRHKRHVKSKVIEVTTVSLNDLLLSKHVPRYFDYLSVDTEGSEFDILFSLDTGKWMPRIITIEHNFVTERRDQIRELLRGYGYVREFEVLSRMDDWYYHPQLLASSEPDGRESLFPI